MNPPLELINVVTALSAAALAFFVIWRERGSLLSFAFVLLAVPVVIWMTGQAIILSGPDHQTVMRWARIISAALAFLPFNLLFFTCAAVGWLARMRWFLIGLFCLGGIYFCLFGLTGIFYGPLYHYSWGHYLSYNAAYFMFFFPVVVFAMVLVFFIFREQYKVSVGIQRKRMKWLMVGVIIAYASTIEYLPAIGIPLRPVGSVPLFAMLCIYTFAIVRYRLVDINAQYAAENVLLAIRGGVVVCDSSGALRVVNDSIASAFGCSKEALLRLSLQDVFLDESRRPLDVHSLNAMRKLNVHAQAYYRLADNNTIPVSLSIAPLFEGRERVGFVVVARDEREKLRLEADLHKLSMALEQSAIFFMITDVSGIIEYVNPSMCQATGYSREELIGKRPNIFKSGEIPAETYKDLWENITSGRKWSGEFLNKAKDGRLFWVLVTINPVCNENGEVTHFISVQEDITERKHNERLLAEAYKNLQQAQEQLIQSAKMESVGRLSAGLAHEVKNPLAIAVLGLEYLKKNMGKRDETIEGVFADMTSALKRADRIVHNMLDYSHPRKEELSPGNLNEAVETVLNLLKHDFNKNNIQIRLQLKDNLPQILLQPNRIEQVLINLFMNAIGAMKKGGSIEVYTRVVVPQSPEARELRIPATSFKLDAPHVVLLVRDSGEGIDEAIVHRLFDPFFTTKAPGEGTGLGLSLVQSTINAHNGSIIVRNAEEGGAEAILIFPTAEEAVRS